MQLFGMPNEKPLIPFWILLQINGKNPSIAFKYKLNTLLEIKL